MFTLQIKNPDIYAQSKKYVTQRLNFVQKAELFPVLRKIKYKGLVNNKLDAMNHSNPYWSYGCHIVQMDIISYNIN